DCRRHYHGADCEPTETAIDSEHRELYRVGHWTLTLPYDYALSGEALHRAAAQALADRLGWAGELVGGALAEGYAFTFAPERTAEERCAACEAPMYVSVRGHHHSEDGRDVTRASV
ncbi:MAG: hypothetical protein ABIV25_04705, partial [Paracoccaceae bacterium]